MLVLWIILGSVAIFAAACAGLLLSGPRMPRRSPASFARLLTRVPAFAGLPREELLRIASVVREVRLPPNVFLIREHRIGDALFLVIEGTLNILKRGSEDQNLVQVIGPGEIVGEMALLTGNVRIASARTETSSVLLQIDRDDFADLMKDHPHTLETVWKACEVHGIGLAMADLEQTRALTLETRRRWLDQRTSVFIAEGDVLEAPSDAAFVAVLGGAVEVEGFEPRPPALVRIDPGQQVKGLRAGRICWLPRPPA